MSETQNPAPVRTSLKWTRTVSSRLEAVIDLSEVTTYDGGRAATAAMKKVYRTASLTFLVWKDHQIEGCWRLTVSLLGWRADGDLYSERIADVRGEYSRQGDAKVAAAWGAVSQVDIATWILQSETSNLQYCTAAQVIPGYCDDEGATQDAYLDEVYG